MYVYGNYTILRIGDLDVVNKKITNLTDVSANDVKLLNEDKEGIYTLSCLVPGIGFLVLAAITFFFYPLSKKRVDENVKILAAKRAGK